MSEKNAEKREQRREHRRERWCYRRHDIVLPVVRVLLWPFMKLRYGFKVKRHHLEKDRPYLILGNHRGFWDPLLISYVFDRPIHFMATDNLFTNGYVSRLMTYWLSPIPKKKQGADLKAVRAAVQIASEKGIVGVFPEGSRSYDGMPTSVDLGIAKLARMMDAEVILCQMYGVFAADPRWGHGKRRGNSYIEVVRTITPEEYAAMDDEQLRTEISNALDVFESPSTMTVKAKAPAEKLESFLYVCPKCGETCHIYSKGDEFGCTACGMKGHIDEHLVLHFDDPDIKIEGLGEWHRIQREYGSSFTAQDGALIFEDEDVRFMDSDRKSGKKTLIGVGKLILYKEKLVFEPAGAGTIEIPVGDIKIISPVGMKKLIVTTTDANYFLESAPGFNSYKYTQIVYTLTGQPDREVK